MRRDPAPSDSLVAQADQGIVLQMRHLSYDAPQTKKLVLFTQETKSFVLNLFCLERKQVIEGKTFKVPAKVTAALTYGPYDNSYILIATADGHLLGITPANLALAFVFKLSHDPITQIKVDPMHSILVVSKSACLNLTLSPGRIKYVYVEFSHNQFCTVELPQSPLTDVQLNLAATLPEEHTTR